MNFWQWRGCLSQFSCGLSRVLLRLLAIPWPFSGQVASSTAQTQPFSPSSGASSRAHQRAGRPLSEPRPPQLCQFSYKRQSCSHLVPLAFSFSCKWQNEWCIRYLNLSFTKVLAWMFPIDVVSVLIGEGLKVWEKCGIYKAWWELMSGVI